MTPNINQKAHKLIQLYLSGKADKKSIEQLKQWLQADEEHCRSFLFEKNLYESTHPVFSPDSIDEEEALQKVLDALQTKKKEKNFSFAQRQHHRRFLLWTAGSAAIIFAIVYIGFNNWRSGTEHISPIISSIGSQEIKPGNSKAILTLSSGQQVTLEKDSAMNIVDDETSIQSRNGKIEYLTSISESGKKVNHHELYVPVGGEYFLQLNDGSKVWLNAGTRLKYPISFSKNERLVYLTGEAYFDIAKDAKRPFKVVCTNSEIAVLGTEFNICNYTGNSTSAITLVQGSVTVKATESGKHLTLSPGEQAVLTHQTVHLDKRKVDTRLYCSWKDGTLFFDHTRLEEIMERLSRWYDVSINWKTPQLKNLTFSGEMKKYESLNEILELLQMTQNMKFEIKERTIIVSK